MKTVYHVNYTYGIVPYGYIATVENVEIALETILTNSITEFTFFDHGKAHEFKKSEMSENAWNGALALAKANYENICFCGKDEDDIWYVYSIIKGYE